MLDPYELKLPPGDWYDYWTGAHVAFVTSTTSRDTEQPLSTTTAKPTAPPNQPMPDPHATAPHPILITPTLDTLPVYVRGGSIIPIQPLVQSTDEKPQGPLTLRVYAPTHSGASCRGTLYQDDGISFAFRNGAFLRMESTCERTPEGLRIHIGKHEGTFQPWWNQIRVEVYGYNSTAAIVTANNQPMPANQTETSPLTTTTTDPGTGIDLLIK
jgi:alpha-glucosidase